MYGLKDWTQKVIAFDYDETISADEEFFIEVMSLFEKRGWKVIVCTWRGEHELDDLESIKKKGFAVYATNRQAKRFFMENRGISVDVWVDDFPQSIIISLDDLNRNVLTWM